MQLLDLLTERPHSGQELADSLGVSRAAVSKAAKVLQRDGYPVVVDRTGYRMTAGTPTHAAMSELLPGRPFVYLGTVTSTQDEIRALSQNGDNAGAVVLAERQTKGRGRLDRTWSSNPGAGLTFSVALRPELSVDRLGLLSLVAGIALAEAIPGSSLKWPNDLLAPDGRKLAGVLAEASTVGEQIASVSLGIGVNVHGPAPEGGASVDTWDPGVRRDELLATIIRRLDGWVVVAQANPDAIADAWRSRTTMLGTAVHARADDRTVNGIAVDIDVTGGLIIRTLDGDTVTVHAGDVTLNA